MLSLDALVVHRECPTRSLMAIVLWAQAQVQAQARDQVLTPKQVQALARDQVQTPKPEGRVRNRLHTLGLGKGS